MAVTLVDEAENQRQDSFQTPVQPNFVALQATLGESGTIALRLSELSAVNDAANSASAHESTGNNPGGGRGVHGVE
ncbi:MULTISPECIES: hypothetical protein [Nocardia]|uniref:hypothetical protein n=1 Tax=Nocardia TaxID=1817 RepID=UPI0012F503E7|nr:MULTISPECIES: hypothetical protein [Nocardia]